MNKNTIAKFVITTGLLLLTAPILLMIIDPLYSWFIFYTFVPGVLLVIIGTGSFLLKFLISKFFSMNESQMKTYSLINNWVVGFSLLAAAFITYWFLIDVL
jgi:hypothetical protein